MIYRIIDNLKYVEAAIARLEDRRDDPSTYIAYLSFSELESRREALGISRYVINTLKEGKDSLQNFLSVQEKCTFGIINVINVEDIFGKRDKIGLYIEKNLFIAIDIIDEDRSTILAFDDAILFNNSEYCSLGRFINNFIKNLITRHNNVCDSLRHEIELLDDEILNDRLNEGIITEISKLNHLLLELYWYYEQLDDLCDVLIENDNGILTEDDTKYFKILSTRLNRYSINVQLLREYTNQVRESYQAQIDISLNKVMKIFTVVATIFLPLTLLVGWYGMNFKHMPELDWVHGYKLVIAMSILITVVCIYYFKKKKLL